MPVAADYLLENPDVARAYKASGSKLTPEQYAYEHYKNYGQAENRSWGMAAPTGKTAQDYYNANPDVWREYNKSGAGSSVQDFATTHWNRYGQDENRSWEMPDPADKTAFTLDDVVPYASPARPAPGPGFTPPEMSEFALAKPTTVADSDVDIDSYVPEATATVAGQMESLMDKNSPYLQQAAKAGERTAQARGLLSSSMAAGAAQGAAMDRALPIAQQDAQTYATNALTVLQG
ncbi:MAG: hypothetical protein GY861_11435, partial [bacterium]|nr:hypothetical protein [bacterium]